MSNSPRLRLLRQLVLNHRGLAAEAAGWPGASAFLSPGSAPCFLPAPGWGTIATRGLIRPAAGGRLPRDKFPSDYQFDDGGFASPDGPSATEMVWPMSRRQQKFSARLLNALEAVIESDFHMVELCRSTGFTILEVRAAPDLRKAYIKWDAFPQRMKAAEIGLARRMNRLRAMTSKKLGSKFMPWLEFRPDGPTDEQAETERALRQVESEMAAEFGAEQEADRSGNFNDGYQWEEPMKYPRLQSKGYLAGADSYKTAQGWDSPTEYLQQQASSLEGDSNEASDHNGETSRIESFGVWSAEAANAHDKESPASEEVSVEEEEEEVRIGDDCVDGKIWDLIAAMAAEGAGEDEIRARVQEEVRQALSGK